MFFPLPLQQLSSEIYCICIFIFTVHGAWLLPHYQVAVQRPALLFDMTFFWLNACSWLISFIKLIFLCQHQCTKSIASTCCFCQRLMQKSSGFIFFTISFSIFFLLRLLAPPSNLSLIIKLEYEKVRNKIIV